MGPFETLRKVYFFKATIGIRSIHLIGKVMFHAA